MPGCFFVISGRNRVQWADEALQGQLDYTGPSAWPGPAARTTAPAAGASAARQVLIGDLPPEDSADYLATRLTDRSGNPLIPTPVRQVIVERSHGLPLYLDLAAQ